MNLVAKVYRYHCPAQDDFSSHSLILRKRRSPATPETHLIAADEKNITDENGTRGIGEFQHMPDRPYVTLTRRESDNIALANPGARAPTALEVLYPWLPRRSYVPDSSVGFEALVQIYQKYRRHFVTALAHCNEKWGTVCNTIRHKSPLDSRFYFAWHTPIQEVFALEETRRDRCVITIDVNAMYPACMQSKFPKPSSLRYLPLAREHVRNEPLVVGLYRCRLSKPSTDFIIAHNPFKTFFCGLRLQAPLDEPVDVDLNEFEIDYYARHFDRIFLVDAVVSDEVIPHPLAKEARRTFARRLSYQSQGNMPLADREKFLATLLSSCTSRPNRFMRTFPNRIRAMNYLQDKCGVSPPSDVPDIASDTWMSRGRGIKVTFDGSGTTVSVPNMIDGSSCSLLGQRIVARGRIHVLDLMERTLTIGNDIQICYVNVDSIHLSVPHREIQKVTSKLSAEASREMGSFKIEVITEHGLWLEPGRYWLYSDHVEKFRNRSIGDGINPFKDSTFRIVSRRVGNLDIPIRTSLKMTKSMSNVRALEYEADDSSIIARQRLIELHSTTSYSSTLEALNTNRSAFTPLRLKAFYRLKANFEESCPAASGQD